jgi:isoquinoline 1-oxidoreductase subunit alpha
MITNFVVNGAPTSTDAPPDTPLLWVIREGLKLTGTKFGCGAGLCGACMVHIDGKRAFSCQTQVSEIGGKSVTTIEGLSPDSNHPVQKAWLAERVPQCAQALTDCSLVMSQTVKLTRPPEASFRSWTSLAESAVPKTM